MDLAPRYFDPVDILSGEQRVRVRLSKTVPWSPILTPDHPISGQVEKGALLDVPVWLAEHLVQDRVAVVVPHRAFGKRVASDLEAGPEALGLRECAQYYYRLGEKCSRQYASVAPRRC